MCIVSVMLILASQRQFLQSFFGMEEYDVSAQPGAKPSLVEWIILSYVSGK